MFSNVDKVTNLRITDSEALPSPAELCEDIARTSEQKALVTRARKEMHDLIDGKDKRLLAVVGPCSIHDLEACRARRPSTGKPTNQDRQSCNTGRGKL